MTDIKRYGIGAFTVTPIADGSGPMRNALLTGITEAECEALLLKAHGNPGPHDISVNTYLIEHGGDLWLIDNGAGDKYGPRLGKLFDNLRAAGHEPSEIRALINTHLHVDHVGGCYADGKALFPNAEFIVGRTEHDYWTNAELRAATPERLRSGFELANDALAAYAGRIRIVSDDAEIFPGIRAVPLPGHTPGHTGYRIKSGGESLLIWGDICHSPVIQLARPEVSTLFDVDQEGARRTRRSLLQEVAERRQLVAGMHTPFPGVGYVERDGEGYRFVAA